MLCMLIRISSHCLEVKVFSSLNIGLNGELNIQLISDVFFRVILVCSKRIRALSLKKLCRVHVSSHY